MPGKRKANAPKAKAVPSNHMEDFDEKDMFSDLFATTSEEEAVTRTRPHRATAKPAGPLQCRSIDLQVWLASPLSLSLEGMIRREPDAPGAFGHPKISILGGEAQNGILGG